MSMRQSRLHTMLQEVASVSTDDALSILNLLTLSPRPGWRIAPPCFDARDWQPWRFRRRVSVLQRPFLKLDETEDPTIAVVPGLVRDSFLIVVSAFHSGDILWSPASKEMDSWIGHARRTRGLAFNSEVAIRMREMGWEVEPEISLTKVLGTSLARNYGDVDVLAWTPASSRVLVMECKNVKYKKTLGEVAEQLSDFRGDVRVDGRPDLLRKHLDRIAV